jgi:stage II sporulation protein D
MKSTKPRSLPAGGVVVNRWLHGVLCLFLILVGFPSGCSQNLPPADFSGKTPIVRVLILQNQSSVTINASEPPSVRSVSEVTIRRVELPEATPIQLTRTPQGWQLGAVTLEDKDFTLIPAVEGSVSINGHAYRGRYHFVARAGGMFDVVNDVDVEGYLKGVVAREMLPNFAPEAYKAQAVVARTYALYQSQMKSPGSRFDLYGDDRDQVYGGISSESAKSREAVEQTHGMVVVYGPPNQEKIFKAYFSSCCGGIGQSAADAFGDPPSVPLSAQAVGTLCSESPRYSWPTITLTKTELTRRLKLYGQKHNRPEKDMAPLNRLDIAAMNTLGRPVKFVATDAHGRRYNYTGEEIRNAVNTDIPANMPHTKLFSSLFQLQNDAATVSFTNGHGLGHGVGMCQWCAQRRAEMGLKFTEIVLDSYPQSKMVTAY